ncbi:chromosome condensation protein CrcB [Bifidobacterium dolichotidis]|uniref:Fluoride-specific ion channel FluC n=1 Tax=Bifidobacterium dolichotidis TaxID=2306976 RepID=A0A430FQX6_9BIFI|nr:CrcB family protein [Bifidobacterium dolichotidis]RSX55204.1 chromosome condensation protein CrcB [Bifidobacterium dolichotidis]
MFTEFLLISACGGLGAVARFVLNTSIQRWWTKAFPMSTFIINTIASLCAGVAAASFFCHTVDNSAYLLFATGFLGGFSTFSTCVNEILALIRGRHFGVATTYFILTIVIPLGAAILGWFIGSL